ncbi:MAG: bifunctional phosphoribosylaminoimidazolecarboxamide formyltransferase/IMP cyclohydrolase [Rickettsiales bacterium]
MPIKTALISVSNKTGLIDFAKFLRDNNVTILSTGGTAKTLRDAGIEVKEVSDHTGFPEIMDGRVKTLHPKIHGGILAVRDNEEHKNALNEHDITTIDLVVINLYPFEETVAKGANFNSCVENIDIGGPSMVRSAAKNHEYITIVTSPNDYASVTTEMKENNGSTTLKTRKLLAAKAYSKTASYDAAISSWLNAKNETDFPENLTIAGKLKQSLHYGENPHQKAAFYTISDIVGTLAAAKQVQGAELSYNNLNDASAAFELVREFEKPAVVIVKHANPCGVAVSDNIVDAFHKALACDPVSAYGGIIAVNRPLNEKFCAALGKLFLEVMIAPDADKKSLEILESRKKLKLLLSGEMKKPAGKMTVKTISGGFLYQEDDTIVTSNELKTVTSTKADDSKLGDLMFAFTIAKHVKSNTIVLARDEATIGIGAGQMSRIDATRIACLKAADAGLDTRGAVLASDAFFPFPDNVEMAAKAGITAIIQPGGSIRDSEVIEEANKNNISMVFTGIRHFRH